MPVITCRDLGKLGRVGNQLFIFCFAYGYAHAHDCELQVPVDWWGRHVFVGADALPPVTAKLPQTERDDVTKRPLNRYFGRTDIDLRVFAQHQCYLDYYTRKQAREWLALKPEFDRLSPSVQPYSAMHKRRGDYQSTAFRNLYATVSDTSYDRAIAQFSIPVPVYLATDGVSNVTATLPRDLSWLPDFVMLRDAAHLLRANSSFSWWASTLGRGKVYAPVVGDKVGWQDCEFVQGNWPTTAGKFANQSDLHLREE